jgi:hypothetical protein
MTTSLDSRSLGAEAADAGKAGIGGVAKSHLMGEYLSVMARLDASVERFFPAGIALAYLAGVSVVFAQETEPPGPLVLAVFALSVVAGLQFGASLRLRCPSVLSLAPSFCWASSTKTSHWSR